MKAACVAGLLACLRIALSSGFAIPIGSFFKGSGDISRTVTGQVPIRFDVGVRFAEHFYAGIGAAYGFLAAGSDVHVGAVAAFHYAPSSWFDPWIAVGSGFEILYLARSMEGLEVDLTARGLQFLEMELGGDFSVAPHVRLGPVFWATMGSFTTVTVNGVPARDFETVIHEWVGLGFRAVYD